jgi:hypothetical protein
MTGRRRTLVAGIAVTVGLVLTGGAALASGLTATAKSLGTASLAPPTFFVNSVLNSNVGANAGKLEAGDKSVAVFGGQAQQSTLCSTWSNASSTQSLAGFTLSLNDNAGSGGTDTLTVTAFPAACASGFHFGTVDLKNAGYVTGGNATFTNSTIALSQTASSTTLTLTLGTAGGAGVLAKVATTSAATYTPDPTVTNTTATAIGVNSATTVTAVQF